MYQRIIMIAAFGAAVCAACYAQAPDLERMDIVLKSIPNGPIAFVNGAAVDSVEFRDLYLGKVQEYMLLNQVNTVPDDMRIRIAVSSMRLLIERAILLQEAEKRKLTVPAKELDERWAQELDNMRKRVGLAGGAEEEVLKRVGADREEARGQLRRTMLIEKMTDAIIQEKGITVSDKEVADFFAANKEKTRQPDMCHIVQIFVQGPEGTSVEAKKKRELARAKTEKALQRIKAGESFEGVAREVCEGALKERAGDMGKLPVAGMPKFLSDAAYQLEPGKVSGVIESPYGFHVIKLIEIVAAQEPTLADVTPDIRRLLLMQKSNDAMRKFCGEVTKPGSIETFLNLDRQIAARPDLLKEFQEMTEGSEKASTPAAKSAEKAPASSTENGAKKSTKASPSKGADTKTKTSTKKAPK